MLERILESLNRAHEERIKNLRFHGRMATFFLTLGFTIMMVGVPLGVTWSWVGGCVMLLCPVSMLLTPAKKWPWSKRYDYPT